MADILRPRRIGWPVIGKPPLYFQEVVDVASAAFPYSREKEAPIRSDGRNAGFGFLGRDAVRFDKSYKFRSPFHADKFCGSYYALSTEFIPHAKNCILRKYFRMSLKTLLTLIDQRLKAQNLSERQACLRAKIGADGIRTMRNGFNPKVDKLKKLAPVLGLTLDDLLHALDPSSPRKPPHMTESPDADAILEIDVHGGAGLGGEAALENLTSSNGSTTSTDAVKGGWILPPEYLAEIRVRPKSIRIIEIFGDSMTRPDGGGIHSGDRVMVDISDRNPTPPGIFALFDGFGVTVKRIERIPRSDPPTIRLISDNPAHRPVEMTLDEVNIIGRLKWFARRL